MKILMSLFLLLNSLLAVVHTLDIFSSILATNYYLGNQTGTVVEIASDESVIMVGYQTGKVQSINFDGQIINNFSNHTSPIFDIKWIPSFGPIVLDTSGFITLSSPNGTILASRSLGSSPTSGMAITSLNSIYYVAINFGSFINEYKLNSNFSFSNSYMPPSNTNLNVIMYSSGYQYLFVGTNTSILLTYNTSTSIFIYEFANIDGTLNVQNNSNIQALSSYGNQYLFLTQAGWFFSFNSTLGVSIGTTFKATSAISVCPSSLYIVAAETFDSTIDVYTGSFLQQQLTYPINIVKSLDCSSSYLVSIDRSNFLAVDKYFTAKFPGWAIGVIVAGSVLIVAAVIVFIVCCIRRRRKRLALEMNGQFNDTMGKELVSPGFSNRQEF